MNGTPEKIIRLAAIEGRIYLDFVKFWEEHGRPLGTKEAKEIATRHSSSTNIASTLNMMVKKGALVQDESRVNHVDRVPVTQGVIVVIGKKQIWPRNGNQTVSKTILAPKDASRKLVVLRDLLSRAKNGTTKIQLNPYARKDMGLTQLEYDALRKQLRVNGATKQKEKGWQELVPSKLKKLIKKIERQEVKPSAPMTVQPPPAPAPPIDQPSEGLTFDSILDAGTEEEIENPLPKLRQRLEGVRQKRAELAQQDMSLADLEEELTGLITSTEQLHRRLALVLAQA